MKQNSGLAHCVHHDIHWEYCYNYQKRVEFIEAVKSYNKALQSCIEELGKFVNIYQGRYDNDVARELLERT